jgi:hypothetical protein
MPPDRQVKCQAAREVIDLLNQDPAVPVLHVGALVLDAWHQQWRRWGADASDDLHLLIRHDELGLFMDRMEQGGYSLVDRRPPAGTCMPLNRHAETPGILKRPVSPHAAYVHQSCIGQGGDPDLWVRFHTTTRHGALLLVDLQNWFSGYDQLATVSVMEDLHPATEVKRPPLWAMLLWQAAQVTSYAADCAITQDEVDKLHVIAAHMSGQEWDTALTNAEEYDQKHRTRVGYCVNTLHMDGQHLQYGVLYELRHALDALAAYGQTAGYQTDWAAVMARVQAGTGQFQRKIWGYAAARGGKYIPPDASRGTVGTVDFGIQEQIEQYGGYGYEDFESNGLVHTVISNAPPHGPWVGSTQAQVDDIFIRFGVP